jgi:hypothetical protein
MAETRCCTSQLYGPIRGQKQKRSPTAWAPDLRIWAVGWRDSNPRPLRPDLPWAWCWSSAVPVHMDEDDHVAPCATIFCGDLGTSARYIEPAWGAGRLRPSPGAVLRAFRVLGDWAVTDRLTTLLAYHGVCNNALIMATSNRKS